MIKRLFKVLGILLSIFLFFWLPYLSANMGKVFFLFSGVISKETTALCFWGNYMLGLLLEFVFWPVVFGIFFLISGIISYIVKNEWDVDFLSNEIVKSIKNIKFSRPVSNGALSLTKSDKKGGLSL